MDFKRLIIRSVLWTIAGIVFGMIGVWYIIEHPIPGANSDVRSRALGEGTGVVMGLGYAVIWLPSCFRLGQQRRARAAHTRKPKPRRRR